MFIDNLICHCVKPIKSLGLQGLDLIQENRKINMNAVSQRIKVKMSRKADVETSLEEEVSVG